MRASSKDLSIIYPGNNLSRYNSGITPGYHWVKCWAAEALLQVHINGLV